MLTKEAKDTPMNSQSSNNSSHSSQSIDAVSTEPLSNTGKCEPLLDSIEAAQLLRIHPKTLQRMARKGEVPAIQIGKLWRFSSSALLLWQQQKLAG
jgi:excisionase family DNA binding protein